MKINLVLVKRPLKDGTCNLVFDLVNGRDFRKKIITGIKLLPLDWDVKRYRVNKTNPNAKVLNIRVKELFDKLLVAHAKYDAKQLNENQLISFLEGKTDFGSIDEYIETEIKNTRTSATYIDYKNAFNSLKLHTKFGNGKMMFEDVNYALLDKFKRNALSKGLQGASINSYLTKIRAVMLDAFDKGYIYEKFELSKRLRVPVQRKQIQTCTPDDLKNAIGKIKNVYDWQAVAFYLLMFCTRGMYPADIVSFKKVNFQNKDLHKDGFISSWDFYKKGHDYLVHRRSKTKNRGNDDMLIRIDAFPTLRLIGLLKRSVIYTHYKIKPDIIPTLEDEISIFKYDIENDYKLHSNIWDTYKKRIIKLLGYSYKTARKTFNTYALELEVSDTIRRILLGHADSSMLSHYDNLKTKKINEQVENAHEKVLDEFDTKEIMNLLIDKLENDLSAPAWVMVKPAWQSNVKYWDKVNADLG